MSAVEQAGARIAQALGCAVTLLHHVSRAVGREGIADVHAGRGAAAFGDNCRSVLRLLPLTPMMVVKEKLEGLDRIEVERGDILKLIHAKLNQDKKSDPVYLRRINGLLEKIEPTVRNDVQSAEVELRALVEWFKRDSVPFTITGAGKTARLDWTKMGRAAATAFVENAVHEKQLVRVGAHKGGARYAPSAELLARFDKPDPFTKEIES
jgi:RecA-family ATPase